MQEERGTAGEGEGAAENAPGEVIRELILGEAADQSSLEEELLDNHPLIDTESDCNQDGAEDTVQEGEAIVQNTPPERSRSRDSIRSRSRKRVPIASPILVEGPRPPLSARNPLILTPDTTEPECGNLSRLSSLGCTHNVQGPDPLQQKLRQSHCPSARRWTPTSCLQQRGWTLKGG